MLIRVFPVARSTRKTTMTLSNACSSICFSERKRLRTLITSPRDPLLRPKKTEKKQHTTARISSNTAKIDTETCFDTFAGEHYLILNDIV